MRKINLQLFASVVDVFKENGMDSSFDSRKKYYEEHYGGTYTGTAEQNLFMAEQVQKGSAPSEQPAPSAQTNTNSGATSNASKQLPVSGNGTQLAQSALSKTFTPSASYQSAMDYTNTLLAQLSSGRTSYTDQIKGMMDQIMNREDFKYDADSDMLFQQYLTSSMATGKQAMQDTMGQAAALTGGYSSTYATSAGNQMYNAYIQDAYDNLPEYYQLALDAYNMEGQEMYNQLAMLNEADATEYGRLYNAWSANNTYAQQLYQQEYGQYSDEVSNAFDLAQFVNSNYWNQKDDEYRYASLLQDKEQFMLSNYDLNKDGVVDENDQNVQLNNNNVDPKHYTGAVEAFEKGGQEKLNEYMNSLQDLYSDSELEAIAAYAGTYGEYEVPLQDREWTLVNDGKKNWGGTDSVDYNGVVKYEENGKTYIYTLKELEELLEKEKEENPEMEDFDVKAWLIQLQRKLGIDSLD